MQKKINMAWGKKNILSHNVVSSRPHHGRDSKFALIAQVVVNLLGIYDQSVVSHFFFFLNMCRNLWANIYCLRLQCINKTLRDRPFNLKGGCYGFLFRSEFFFRTTKELEYLLFFSRI